MCGLVACAQADTPNVIFIYYDDMGYSDMGAYDTTQTSLTPNLDTLASEGVRFTAGHSSDGVCTPSRYSVMTGRYSWRTNRKTGVTGGYSSPLMAADRFTFAKMFQSLGYTTAMVGKWHIGMQFYDPSGSPVDLNNNANVLDDDDTTTSGDSVDFSKALTQTPTTNGFDYFFGSSASLDMPPYVWIENETVLFKGGIVTGGIVDFSQASAATNADFLEGQPIGAVNIVRYGAYDPNFIVSDYMQVQAQKVADLIEDYSASGVPFFIYVPMPAPHRPWSVNATFAGSTPYSYGDYLKQTDHYTGVILDALADPDGNPGTNDSLVNDTVVFISSDNGPENSAYEASRTAGRDSNGPFRGVKRDNWEGGTRVPFLIRWPGKVTAGTTSDHACWQGDFFATMAAYLGYDFSEDEAPDAESFLPVLLGNSMQPERREGFIQHSVSGQHAIVDKNGEWKLLDGTGGDGNETSYDADDVNITSAKGTRAGTPRQLFNLLTDSGERSNRLLSPTQDDLDKEAELYALLNEIRGDTNYGTDGDSNVPAPDNDQDGMVNLFENTYPELDRDDASDAGADLEPDGLTNLQESQYGGSPLDADSDGDRLGDAAEAFTYGTQVGSAHSDSDDLEDGDEVLIWHTDPLVADSDGDGMDDDVELAAFSDPRNASSTAVPVPDTVTSLDPDIVQLAGVNGTSTDPAVQGATGWSESGTLYVRERLSGGSSQEQRTRLFLKFDLSGITGTVESARLRVHQNHRLNTQFSADIALVRVTESWGTSSGVYPLFDGTGVTDSFVFGNNEDFGTAVDASGFFSGTVGTPGTDEGFDVTTLVQGWANGSYSNHGVRIAFNSQDYVGAAFSDADDAATLDVNEALQLIVTTSTPPESLDGDNDGLADEYELDVYTNLGTHGSDDGDLDGLSTFVEQALGSDPRSGASRPAVKLITTNSPDVELSFHRFNRGGLGVEVMVSEDLNTWEDFTQFYQVAYPAPSSELGMNYDKVLLEPHSPLPEKLFYQLKVHGQP